MERTAARRVRTHDTWPPGDSWPEGCWDRPHQPSLASETERRETCDDIENRRSEWVGITPNRRVTDGLAEWQLANSDPVGESSILDVPNVRLPIADAVWNLAVETTQDTPADGSEAVENRIAGEYGRRTTPERRATRESEIPGLHRYGGLSETSRTAKTPATGFLASSRDLIVTHRAVARSTIREP